jgi:putative tricarboxylic transport membrane protein
MIENLAIGLSIGLTVPNLVAAVVGTIGGIIIGALPGLSATMGVALLVPVTFLMSPVTGLIMLSGIYCGGIYGGSITGILLNTPGTAAAIVTMIDGHKMTQKGEPKKALSTAILASFAGGLISAFVLLFFSPILANLALRFGPPEYFCLALFGMTVISSLTTVGSVLKGIIVGFFGVFISTVGMDPNLGVPRLTFGQLGLMEGFGVIPVLIGLFSIPEALELAVNPLSSTALVRKLKGGPFLEMSEYLRMAGNFIKSSLIGTIIGIIPAAGPVIAPFVSYREAKRSSKFPEKFGTGIPDGIVAAEAANNGVTGGSLVPLLTLGIPGSAVAAVYLGALTIHGLRPGPMLFRNNPDVVYGLFIGFFVVQFVMLGLGLWGSNLFAQVIRLPTSIIAAFIFFFSIMGALAMNANLFDVWVMLAFGILGFFMKRYGFPAAPIVLGVILGPMLEQNLFSSLAMSKGNPLIFVTRPLSILILLLSAVSLLTPYLGSLKKIFTKR